MEGVSANVYKGLTGYWRRRGYERLNRRRNNRVELASNRRSRRRFWKVKITPKLKLNLRCSPKKFFTRLRDAYVNMMMRVGSTSLVCSGFGGYGGDGVGGFVMGGPLKDCDERMIVEIYKSLMVAQGQLVTREAAGIGTQIVCRR